MVLRISCSSGSRQPVIEFHDSVYMGFLLSWLSCSPAPQEDCLRCPGGRKRYVGRVLGAPLRANFAPSLSRPAPPCVAAQPRRASPVGRPGFGFDRWVQCWATGGVEGAAIRGPAVEGAA